MLTVFVVFTTARAQTRLVLNGGIINLSQGVTLVIDNPNADAIVRNSGHIISEGETSSIKWNIGTTTGTYIVPWGYGATNYIPVSFTKASGAGSGYFLFSTYHTLWNNVAQLPTGVSNINGSNGTDNSAFVSDRFWQVNAQDYSTKPALTNLQFTYLDSENNAPNTITESKLKAKRYNSTLNSWIDNILTGTVNTSSNIVTVSSVDAANLQTWWMLGTLNSDRYWVATANSNSSLSTNWAETSGGIGNAGIPTLDDAVYFDGSSDFDCAVDASFFAQSLTVASGFSGVITHGTNAISVGDDAVFSGGSFIGGNSTVAVGGDFIVSGSTFTSPATLDIKGNFGVASGTFTHNNGTVAFSGASGTTQNITSATATTFNNITVTNTTANPGVSVESNQYMAGILTLTSNVIFDADGSGNNKVFKLLSAADDPTQDASVAILPPGAQVTGQVTVQRFMSKEGYNNNRIYRYISSPVQNATVSDLQQEIPVSGSFIGKSVCSGCTSNQSLFAYNESIITDNDGSSVYTEHDGYIDFPDVNNTEIFQPGRGYALFVRGNILPTALWDVHGPINTGNGIPFNFPVTYTSAGMPGYDGWNLIGNPFPSTIDWNAASGWTKTNISGSIYTTDNGGIGIQTAAWNGVTGTNGGTRYVAMGQGFWVKADGSGSPVLQATENIKAAGVQTTFFREADPSNLLRITMAQGLIRDEAVIHFREDATEDYDLHADALKLANTTFNLSTLQADGKALAINSLSSITCNAAIQLNIENAANGNYLLKFSEYESFPANIDILLFDNLTGQKTNIEGSSPYNFTVSADPASYGPLRFTVTFELPALDTEIMVSSSKICDRSNAIVQIENTQQDVTYTITSTTGSTVNSGPGNGGSLLFTIPPAELTEGENAFLVQSSWSGCNLKVEKSIVIDISPQYVTSIVGVKNICQQGTTTIKVTGAPEGGAYNWYDSGPSDTPMPGEHLDSLKTSWLSKSKTYYVSITNQAGCEGPKQSVVAEVIHFENAEITVAEGGTILLSNHPSNNQWYFQNVKIPSEIESSIIPVESGNYGLEVTINGCVSTASFEYAITGVEEPGIDFMTLYPNPVIRELMLTVPESFGEVHEVTLMNGGGQFIKKLTKIGSREKVFVFDMSDLPTGVYIVRVSGGNGTHEQKLLKN